MRIRLILFGLLLLTGCQVPLRESDFIPPVPPQTDLHCGDAQATVNISVASPVIEIGSRFAVDIRFTNLGGGRTYCDLFLDGLAPPMPAELNLYDAKGNLLGDLLFWTGGSNRGLREGDFTWVPGDGYVGLKEEFTAGYVPINARFGYLPNDFPPGDYYLQLVYHPQILAQTMEEARKPDEFGWAPFRSNPLKLTFVRNPRQLPPERPTH